MIGICIVNFYSVRSVGELLRSLESMELGDARVYIEDNSEEAPALDRLAESSRLQVSVAASGHNLGYAAGNNNAAVRAVGDGADIIWVLNPDVTVLDFDLRAVISQVQRRTAIFGTPTVQEGVRTSGLGMLNLLTTRSSRVVNAAHELPMGRRASYLSVAYVSGHSLICDARLWRALGGFSEAYFLFFEESDLAVRARSLGIEIEAAAGVTVSHRGGLSTGATRRRQERSIITCRHSSRSCLIFARRHRKVLVPWVVTARLAYAAVMALQAGRACGLAVLIGIREGLIWRQR